MKRPLLSIPAMFCLALPLTAQTTPVITTLAGTGTFGYSGDGADAALAELASPAGVAVDGDGNVYFVDYPGDVTGEASRIRRVDHVTGTITTVVGGGTVPYPNDGELATDVEIWSYGAIAVDAGGNLYFEDYPAGEELLRRVDAITRQISTVAGGNPPTSFASHRTLETNGFFEYLYPSPAGIGDGGPATSAYLFDLRDIAFDSAGNIYLADGVRIRRIDAATQIITTVAGTGEEHAVYIGPIYGPARQWIAGNGVFTGDGELATNTGLTRVRSITFDGGGNLYIAEEGFRQGFVGAGGLVGYTGPLDVIEVAGATVLVDRTTQAVLATVVGTSYLTNLASPLLGNQAETIGVSLVRRVDAATGIVTTVAGNPNRLDWTPLFDGVLYGEGGPAAGALLPGIAGLAFDTSGNLFVADNSSRVLRIDGATQIITTIAGGATAGYGGDGGAAVSAQLARPQDLAFDAAGDLLVADFDNYRVRKISGLTTNAPPTADAGPDQSIHASGAVQLDGSGSFDDNTATASLGFAWTLTQRPAGSVAMLDDPASATPAFVADLPGTYIAELVVTDGDSLASAPDQVEVSSTNLAPTAEAGPDQVNYVGQLVTLDGSASTDPELDPLAYSWAFTQVPALSVADLWDSSLVSPSFVPDLPGSYVVALLVDDGFALSLVDEVVVTVITGQEFSEIVVVEAITTLASLPSTSVSTPGNQDTLVRYLSQAAQAIDNDNVAQARQRLEKALDRTDGCVLRGAPDVTGSSRDWVTDCAAQATLYNELMLALAALEP